MNRSRKLLGAIAAVLTLTATAALAVEPHPGAGDPRIAEVFYNPSDVVELKGVLGYQLSLEFDPTEHIENVAIGDALAWQVTPNRKANLLFLKPMARRPDTNMTVITNLRRYNFQLSVRKHAPARAIAYSVRFVYPAPVLARIEPPAPPAPPVDRNHAYSYQGSTKALPTQLFDDGQSTYFAFATDADLPAIYAVEADGGEGVVNSHILLGFTVVDRIAPGFVLRRGAEVTKVFNDGWRGQQTSALSPKPRTADKPWWRK
jgi:type IV secretion system protein VirB9